MSNLPSSLSTDLPANPPVLSPSDALGLLSQHSSDVLLRFTPQGKILWCSSSIEIWGLAPEDVQGQLVTNLVDQSDLPGVLDSIKAVRANCKPVVRLVRLNNQLQQNPSAPQWIEVSLHCVSNPSKTVQEYQAVARDVSKRHEELLAHRNASLHDSLTGLANRTLLLDRLEHALVQSKRNKTKVGVLFCDLDRFKLVNDTYGHVCGDLILQEVASRLKKAVRASDTVARLSGDEFVVVCPDLAASSPTGSMGSVAETIRTSFAQPFEISKKTLWVTSSIGYTTAGPTDTAMSLLDSSDTAMYQAKTLGRDRCEKFDSARTETRSQDLEIVSALHDAWHADKFTLVYQPLIDTFGVPVGLEAFLRLDDDRYKHLTPDELLAPIVETELIEHVGAYVLQKALTQAKPWLENTSLCLHVNLAPRQLFSSKFPSLVSDLLKAQGLPEHCLCLELSETGYLAARNRVVPTIDSLRQRGVKIAIDDFGSGTASLTALSTLPADFLKLDGSLISEAGESAHTAALLAAVVQLAKVLSLTTVAEQVEMTKTVGVASALGVEVLQGFAISHPLSPERVGEFLKRQPM